jgi:hypothetical protein
MSDTINTTPESVSLTEQIRIFNLKKIELEKQQKEYEEKMAQLQKELEDKLNDPAEKAKLLKNATDKIDEALAEYTANGYSCFAEKDEYGTIKNISFYLPGSKPKGTRGPRKKAGDEGHIPTMTRDQFVEIYSTLGKEFKKKDIVDALVKKFGNGKYTDFHPQPGLGNILDNGYEGIKIEKVGTQGRNVYYKKIS